MTPEDEEFERIYREIRRRSEEDDDIQDYKKPWVNLTDKEIDALESATDTLDFPQTVRAIETELKRKNF